MRVTGFLIFISFLTLETSAADGLVPSRASIKRCVVSALGLGRGALDHAKSAAEGGADFVKRQSESAARVTELADSILKTVRDAGPIVGEIQELACVAGKCGWSFSAALPLATFKAAVRVIRFEPDAAGVRTEIVVPLVGYLGTIRELRGQKASEEAMARTLAQFLVFLVEAGLKTQKVVVDVAMDGVPKVGVSTIGAVVGQSSVSIQVHQSALVGDLVSAFLGETIRTAWSALTSSGLTTNQRIALITDLATSANVAVLRIAEQLGWKEFEAEISAWRVQHPGIENAEPSPDETNIVSPE